MKILALDTSTMLGGVAIMDDREGLLAELRLNIKSTHSERLLSGIRAALDQAGLGVEDMDAFGLAAGPGSFTGLRIGLSAVKGLAYATGIPVATVPTLEAFAWSFFHCSLPVCVMLDARKKEVYAAVFRWTGGIPQRILAEVALSPEELLRRLEGPTLFAGEGAVIYRDLIVETLGRSAVFAPPQWIVPSPSSVAFLCLQKAKTGDFAEVKSLAPFYIRKSEAEMKAGGGG